MSIAANKVPGVRAALAHCAHDAQQGREHNHANVLRSPGARWSPILPWPSSTFLHTRFAGGRHERRVAKLTALEQHARGVV